MKAVSRLSVLAVAVVALALAALPAAATTYVPVSDQALLEAASAVVEARVLSVEPAPVTGRWPATDTMIEVHRVVAGEVGGRNLLVRLPGGTRPDGSGVELHGIPRFGIGERLLLFLAPGDDGTFAVVHLMLGAFRERVVGGRRVLLRDLSGAVGVEMPGNPPLAQLLGPRDADAFGRWLSDAARGIDRDADYFLADEEVQGVERVTADYRLFESEQRGLNMRWFDFDAGEDVPFHIANGGQPGYGEAATAAAVRAGIGAWNGARGTNIRYRYAGPTGNTTLNIIEFDNAGDAIDTSFNCATGGVLAIGGPFIDQSLSEPGPNGKRYHRITSAGIVTNKNIQCFLDRVPNGLAQLLAHELGHTLGIHHPCGDGGKSCDVANEVEEDALMYPFIHNDARGARINEDDRAAARALYPGNTGGGGAPPAAPSDLTATALSSREVELSWSDNSSNESQFRVDAKAAGGTWVRVATTGANSIGTVVADLLPATEYAFRVQARNRNAGSPLSGEAMATTLPLTPGSFSGEAASATGVVLTWSDESSDESGFLIELRTPSSGAWVPMATVPPDTTSWPLESLLTGVPHSFRIRALHGEAASLPSEVVSLTPQAPDAPCGGAPDVLCLQQRFRVTVHWNNPHPAGGFGTGTAAAFEGDQSGTFWFFNEANVELIVKVLDARTVNDHFWVFHGALTDSEYWISVLDTQTGVAKTYYNPPFDRCGEFDTAAIPGGALPAASSAPALVFPNQARAEAAETASCGDDDTLCLLGDRFQVQVDWAVEGTTDHGVGRKVTGSDQTGYFWFFDQANIELVVKMIDATSIGGGFWLFYGSLSDVQYTLEVTDTVAQETMPYVNMQGDQCGEFDTSAFPLLADGFTAP